MATYNVSTPEELRQRIQAALTGDVIILDAGVTFASITSLAKIICGIPFSAASGYVITGDNATILDTRILQQNIDADLGPGSLVGSAQKLILSYTVGGATDGNALLSATRASYSLDNVTITGQNRGWAGNGYNYMALTTFNYDAPIAVDLTIQSTLIDITGQGNFDPSVANGGGSAFLHSWNNSGTVNLLDSIFDESGYLATFNFLNFSAPDGSPPTVGSYTISGNIFTRSNFVDVARSEGNRLGNVAATLANNTFDNGSYLQLAGNLSGVVFEGSNTFTSVAGGYGILVDGAVTTNPVLNSAQIDFSGAGTPVYYKTSAGGNGFSLLGGVSSQVTINGEAYTSLVVGGQGNDTLTGAGNAYVVGDLGDDSITTESGNDKIFGDLGNDTINSSAGNDSVYGGDGNDVIDSGLGNDSVEGGIGNDTLTGGGGTDIILGGDGSDLIIGGAANDTLTGGLGADIFQIANLDGTDTIIDFTSSGAEPDRIAINATGMGLTSGATLAAGNVTSATALNGTAISPVTSYNNKLIKITSASTVGQTALITNLQNAYVLLFNSSAGNAQLYFDDNWGNIASRRFLANISNITSLSATLALTNTSFMAI